MGDLRGVEEPYSLLMKPLYGRCFFLDVHETWAELISIGIIYPRSVPLRLHLS
jgi:hypothetical protein